MRLHAPFLLISLLALSLTACAGGSPVDNNRDAAAFSSSSSGSAFSSGATGGSTTLGVPVITNSPGPNDITPGQILVQFKPGASNAATTHAKVGGTYRSTIDGLGTHVVGVPAGQERAYVAAYQREASVQYAEPDGIVAACFVPNDTNYNLLWAMPKISAPLAWDVTHGSTSVKVAVLDTGMETAHLDLAGKMVASKNFTSSSTSIVDGHGHGSHCSGTVAAVTNNARGVAGVGYDTKLMIGKVLSNSGSGSFSWVASGVTWAADNGAHVISMSLGSTGGSTTLQNAINYAWGKNVLVVAAAGNNNSGGNFYPAVYTNCVAVGATDSADKRASFSNYGAWVDLSAPGVNIYSCYKRSWSSSTRYTYMSGTSMAAPHVAGLAALVLAVNPGMTVANLRAKLESTTDVIATDQPLGTGRINAARAVGAI